MAYICSIIIYCSAIKVSKHNAIMDSKLADDYISEISVKQE